MTQHMNAKDRNEYNSFIKGKGPANKVEKKPLVPSPLGFPLYGNMPPMSFLQQNRPPLPMGQMGPMGNNFYQQKWSL